MPKDQICEDVQIFDEAPAYSASPALPEEQARCREDQQQASLHPLPQSQIERLLQEDDLSHKGRRTSLVWQKEGLDCLHELPQAQKIPSPVPKVCSFTHRHGAVWKSQASHGFLRQDQVSQDVQQVTEDASGLQSLLEEQAWSHHQQPQTSLQEVLGTRQINQILYEYALPNHGNPASVVWLPPPQWKARTARNTFQKLPSSRCLPQMSQGQAVSADLHCNHQAWSPQQEE